MYFSQTSHHLSETASSLGAGRASVIDVSTARELLGAALESGLPVVADLLIDLLVQIRSASSQSSSSVLTSSPRFPSFVHVRHLQWVVSMCQHQLGQMRTPYLYCYAAEEQSKGNFTAHDYNCISSFVGL